MDELCTDAPDVLLEAWTPVADPDAEECTDPLDAFVEVVRIEAPVAVECDEIVEAAPDE